MKRAHHSAYSGGSTKGRKIKRLRVSIGEPRGTYYADLSVGTGSCSSGRFSRRIGDLADEVPESPEAEEYRRACATSAAAETDSDEEMEEQSTQPYTDPRRNGFSNSGLNEREEADIFCILHPGSIAAHDAVLATMKHAPQNILQNDDLLDQPFDEEDLQLTSTASSRDIALRFSSKVKDPTMGFVFGRHPSRCDVLLTTAQDEKHVSNKHFRIFINKDGILMLQDQSTNGTIVDDNRLQIKGPAGKASQNMLVHGSIISVLANRSEEIKFIVRIPSRDNCESAYVQNLRKYMAAMPWQGKSDFLTMPSIDHAHGMHWNGGSQYNITGQIGKGAFATVYKLATKKDGLVFAAKELDKRRFMKNGILDLKVDNEVWIMRDLTHPNIVQYVDYQDYGHWLYIIMEFVAGGELGTYINRHGPMSETMGQTVSYQVLCALDYLHKKNVTHRDIKPDNILIASYDPLQVKLSDFGLSKVVEKETFLKTFCGTLLYCAPEVYPDYERYVAGEGRKRRRVGDLVPKKNPYDSSVDMWSFGAVLFQLLSGKPPFLGRGDDKGAEMLRNIMTKDPDFSPLRQRGISEVGIDFVGKLLTRNPALRPSEWDCFRHSWISHLAGAMVDTQTEPEKYHLTEPLSLGRIDEDEEDDLGASHLEIHDRATEFGNEQFDMSEVDSMGAYVQHSKRARRASDPHTHEEIPSTPEVAYPSLPDIDDSPALPVQPPGTTQAPGRLFGEISATALQSSGVLGEIVRPDLDVPAFGNRDELISVNDFVTTNGESPPSNDVPTQPPLQYPQSLPVPNRLGGSAPSLMGAEALVGQLNMGSPEAGPSAGSTPNTNNPATPKTREASPAVSNPEAAGLAEHSGAAASVASSKDKPVERRISIPEPPSTYSTLPQPAATDASSARSARLEDRDETAPEAGELARTTDEKTGEEVPNNGPATSERGRDDKDSWQISRSIDTIASEVDFKGDQFAKPPPLLGKLTSVRGSIADITVRLTSRGTSWGRSPQCTVSYPDKQDTRIPGIALEMTLWAPQIEQRIANGEDWMKIPNLCTVVSTQARNGIFINEKHLKKESPEQDARLYGKLYTGDIIRIFRLGDSFLEFRCEFTYGDSARMRPASENPFVVEKEFFHHQAKKERESMTTISG